MFSLSANWCKGMEACNAAGEAVSYNDPAAVAWDLTGGLCALFGWERAESLFPVLDRHCTSRKKRPKAANPAISSMVALQEFNDANGTTHDVLLERLQTIPVSIGADREAVLSAAPADDRGDEA
jgi:hypothetical protein